MATSKKRITTNLEDKTFAIIEKYAELQGKSKAAVVSELLDTVTPFMVTPIKAMEKARQVPESVKGELSDLFEQVEKDFFTVVEQSKQADLFTGKKH